MTGLIRLIDKTLVAGYVFLAGWLRRVRLAATPAGTAQSSTWVAVKLVGMGDAVLMLPALAAIRTAPGSRLVVVTTVRCAAVFSAPGVADEVIVLRRHGLAARLRALFGALRRADGVLDFEQHVFWSAAVALLAGPRARLFGFRTGSAARNRAFDTLVDPGPGVRHMKEIFDDLARSAGFQPVPGLLPLPVAPSAQTRVGEWMAGQGLAAGQFVVIAPGSGGTVAFRRLPASTWAEIVAGLPPGFPVVLAGTGHEAALLGAIQSLAARSVILVTDFSLPELAALLARAARVIATDSGPMHLAAAMGARVLGVFGPDTPLRYRPYNDHSHSISLHLACSPCNNCWIYREARCTNPDRYACIQRLPAERVTGQFQLTALQAGLDARSRSAIAAEGTDDQGQDDRP